MGLLDGYRQRQALKTAEHNLRIEEIRVQKKVIEAISSRDLDPLRDADADQWTAIEGGDPNNPRKIDSSDAEDLYNQAQKFYYRTPHGRNIVRLIEKYVVGRGFQITPVAEEEDLREQWDLFWTTNRWEQRKKEWVRRVMRSGEAFLRYFNQGSTVVVRFMDPMAIKEPDETGAGGQASGNPSWGIETHPEDIETVLAYWFKNSRIGADEVQHTKIYADSDVKRGRTIYEPIAPDLTLYRDWIQDRMKLNKIRAVLGLVRKVEGSTTKAANIAKGYETSKLKNPDGSRQSQLPESVSILTTNKGVEYDLMSPNLQAADVQHDGRTLLLSTSAGVGLPEFMVTSDSSNANYASTMVAEGPAVMEFEDWQDFFKEEFKIMFSKVINTQIARGLINEFVTKEVEEDTGILDEFGVEIKKTTIVTERISTDCDIQFPDVAVHDILKETQAVSAQDMAGYISKHTATAKLGYNYEDEQELIEQEVEDEIEMKEPFATEEPQDDEADEERGAEPVERDREPRE